MSVRVFPSNMVFGINPEALAKPISNLPPDVVKIRFRVRNVDFAKVFVKTESAITGWFMKDCGNTLELVHPFAINSKAS